MQTVRNLDNYARIELPRERRSSIVVVSLTKRSRAARASIARTLLLTCRGVGVTRLTTGRELRWNHLGPASSHAPPKRPWLSEGEALCTGPMFFASIAHKVMHEISSKGRPQCLQ